MTKAIGCSLCGVEPVDSALRGGDHVCVEPSLVEQLKPQLVEMLEKEGIDPGPWQLPVREWVEGEGEG